jgi:hypothetical protein
MSLWSLLVPTATTNLITNPSIEVAATGYGALNCSVARSNTKYRRGSYSLAVTPSGAGNPYTWFDTVIAATGSYTFGVDVWAPLDGYTYAMQMQINSPYAVFATLSFLGTGAWQRLTMTGTAPTTGTLRAQISRANAANTTPFYVDGLQLEALAYATTYVDGSLALTAAEQQAGFLASGVAWTGTEHASTSTRTAASRRGGVWKDLRTDLGFCVKSPLGLGAPPVKTTRTELANPKAPGSLFEHAHETERTITLQGTIIGTSLANLHTRRDFLQLYMRVNPNGSSGDDEPFMLRYAGRAVTQEIACHYEGGLEGVASNGFLEDVAVSLIADYPNWADSLI